MEYFSLGDAQRCILEHCASSGSETVALTRALGRVLAEPVSANRDHPPYDVSAMDGYAVRAGDLHCIPAKLAVVEDIRAGAMPTLTLAPGQCARIMTGAPIPPGADTVIRIEDTQAVSIGSVQIDQPALQGKDIRRRGENLRNGAVLFDAGVEITPGVLGMLAMVKCAQVAVCRRPRVAILSSGDELEGLDEPFDPNKIPDANSYTLMAQLQALGIEPVLLGIARDDPAELAEYLQRGLKFDVLLVSGGTSVGVHDYVRPTIEALGVQMKFWRVAMKPGHPVAFGTLQRDVSGTSNKAVLVFCLPGNPVSSMVCYEQFVAPALRRMMGHIRLHRRTIAARLTHHLKHQPGRTEFVRVTLAKEPGGYAVTSTGAQGSGVLLSMAHADGLLVMPAGSTGMSAGEQVTVQLLDGTVFQDEAGFGE